ncbi:MAG: DUF1989 domain-containing protein, partial [Pseudomonadota bacterium]
MSDETILREIRNGRDPAQGRRFTGLEAGHPAVTFALDPRQAIRISLAEGDVLALEGDRGEETDIAIAAFDDRGRTALASLGLTPTGSLDPGSFQSGAFKGWLTAQGAEDGADTPAALVPSAAEDGSPALLRATIRCEIWVVRGAAASDLVAGGADGALTIRLKRADQRTRLLPPPLGEIREEFTIPRGTAQSYELRRGEVAQIIDVEGQQCSDFMALRADALERGVERIIDSTVSRTVAGGAYPAPGLFDKFLDADMRPLLNVVQDTVGRHDTFALACTARGYEERGFPGHLNCSDNISNALSPYGVARRGAWPAINFFFNSWIDHADNRLQSEEAWSRPGDYVALRAMEDLVCASTACPDDIDPINGWNPTDIHVRIYRPDAPIRRAVAHREKESATMSLSEESAFHPRLSELTQRFAPARDLWAPVSFPAIGALGEYWACREAATLQDMSSLRKYDVVGPDAEKLLQRAMTRDIGKIALWRGAYMLMCDAEGTVIDDGTLFRIGPGLFRWCCGTEESARSLTALAETHGLQARIKAMRGALPNLALQGPKSRDILREVVFTQPNRPSLDNLKWFGFTIA